MKNYIWAIFDGKLIYAKRKGGLWYDARTNKKLNPQPTKEDAKQ